MWRSNRFVHPRYSEYTINTGSRTAGGGGGDDGGGSGGGGQDPGNDDSDDIDFGNRFFLKLQDICSISVNVYVLLE